MEQAARSGQGRWDSLIARLIWASLVALHLAPIVRLLPEVIAAGENLGSLAALLLVQTLFVLKAVDVPWLRWGGRRGTLVALILLALVGHSDVAADSAEQMPLAAPAASVLTATIAGAWLIRRRRWLPRWSLQAARGLHRLPHALNRPATDLIADLLPSRRSIASVPCFAGRGPPR